MLLLISKVTEKSIHDQMQDYLQRNELLQIYQSCFRANRSTDTCLSQINNMILNSTEMGTMILINLQKNFDY